MAAEDTFGATFAPFPDPSGTNTSRLPIQQAIQMLSLRVPRVVGAAAPASAALLNSPGSSGRPDIHSAVLQTILKTIMGQGAPMTDAAPPSSPVGPPPSAVPTIGRPFAAPQREPAPAPPVGPAPKPRLDFQPDLQGGTAVAPPDRRMSGMPDATERRRNKQV